MKVVLFCGGLGMRLRDYSEKVPKPMVKIGFRPILWHVMKYYAHYGHKDFLLCLGYKADVIKDYFIKYNEYISNDFVLKGGRNNIELLNKDISDWTITFVDTGFNASIGERLIAVKDYLKDEEIFLANYSDGLTDMNLNNYIEWFRKQPDKVASFMAYQPKYSFHVVQREQDGLVKSISHINSAGLFINTGYFIMRNTFFNYIKYGDEIVEKPFRKLIKEKKLVSWKHEGFWASMDTYKDKQLLDEKFEKGDRPWEVWNNKPIK